MNPNQPTPAPIPTPIQQPVPVPPAPQQANDDSMQALIPTKNKPALIAYYCGVFGLVPFLGLPCAIIAVILGKKGLSQYNANPTPGAKVHAKIGLILGIIELSIFALFVILMIIIGMQD